LRLSQALVDEIVAHARDEAPNECCGIVAGKDGEATRVYPATNAAASPVRYEIAPEDLLRIWNDIDDRGWVLEDHSHVKSAAYPSQTDINLAHNWPNAVYLIVSLANLDDPELSGFTIVDGRVEAVGRGARDRVARLHG
jgi:proteasome lid subunit RPN8/RPN11